MPIDPKNLTAGVKELRATANLLLAWADDLEKAGAPAPKPVPAAKNPIPPVPTAPYEAQAVKQFLVFVCSRGYSNQVKALIASYGVKILSAVPAEAYGDIVETILPMYEAAVEALKAEAADGGDSNDPPPYDAKAAQKAAEAKIEAWAERLRLNRLKDCQEKGDTGYGTLPYGGEPDAR